MLILDTHAFIWLASDLKELSQKAKESILAHSSDLYVCSISALEISLLVRKKKLILPLPPQEFIEKALKVHHIEDLPISWKIAHESTQLPQIHNDPFDRLIIACTQFYKARLLSKDSTIHKYPDIDVIWE